MHQFNARQERFSGHIDAFPVICQQAIWLKMWQMMLAVLHFAKLREIRR
jgi:hypothetical protein